MSHIHGEALNIITFNDSSSLELNKVELDQLLLHPDVKNRKVVILSIVGAFRKGKSFFLDYCLRFLYGTYRSIKNPNHDVNNNNDSWMGSADEPLQGFSWRSGTTRETTGIIFWSDVFLYDNPNGEKLAILVVDTQGLFDNETSTADNSKIFSLSTLLTSVQILNLKGLVQEDQLQYLQFATESAKFTSNNKKNDFKPFQSFMFLIRDWNNPDEHQFGLDGGQRYLDNLLMVQANQSEELKLVRVFIKSSFDKLSCCLLPYPGKNVARNLKYDGRWSSMEEDFRDELKAVIVQLLKPVNLVTKRINNIEMNAEMINDYIQQYVTLFQSGSSAIQPKSIYETTIDKFMMSLVARSFEVYKNHLANTKDSIQNENGIAHVFSSSKEAAYIAYNAERKMGTVYHANKYKSILNKKIEDDSIEWKAVTLAHIMQLQEERKVFEETAKETERLRLQRIEEQRIAQELIAQLEREIHENEAKAARQREILQQQQLAIQAEQEKQRIAEEHRHWEIVEAQRIQAEIARIASTRRHQKGRNCSIL